MESDRNKSKSATDVKKGEDFNSSKEREPAQHSEKSSHANANANNGSKQSHNKNNGQSKSSRPYREREIYRPPSLRSKTSRNMGNQSGNSSSHKGNANNNSNKIGMCNNNGNNYPTANGASVLHSPHLNRRQFAYGNNVGATASQGRNVNLSLNVNAQEFQLTASQQQQIQNQQLANLLQLDPNFYGDVFNMGASATTNLGIYSLQQSKSLGNNLNVLLQQQQAHQQPMSAMGKQPPQFNAPFGLGGALAFLQQTQRSQAILTSNNFSHLPQNQDEIGVVNGQFNRLTHSKSSGCIPDNLNKPRVRFDVDSDDRDEASVSLIRNAETRFSDMNMNGIPQQQRASIMSQKQHLQKSRTGFVLNLYAPNQHLQKCMKQPTQEISNGYQGAVKRSRSFGAGSTSVATSPTTTPQKLSGGRLGQGVLFSSLHSVYSDFHISKWPKQVQETVTTAVTAVDRVAARQQIEMVNMIFEAMLIDDPQKGVDQTPETIKEAAGEENIENKSDAGNSPFLENDLDGQHQDDDLSTPAVHIFLYFIQREKDRTVMESLLNTCFATFQKLFGTNRRNFTTTSTTLAAQSMIFLKFISCLYSQVKLLRRQKPGGRALDEMSFSVLAVLCDSCLSILRSQLSSDPESMGCLFTVLTSQGRDIEGNFPLKMKQLLAAVRDALLGIGPYTQGSLCPTVQKTLMQLIELHANSWSLPANAVRYYYSAKNVNATYSTVPHTKNNNFSVSST